MSIAELSLKAEIPAQVAPQPRRSWHAEISAYLAEIELAGLLALNYGISATAHMLSVHIPGKDYFLPGLFGIAVASVIAVSQGAYSLCSLISLKRSLMAGMSSIVPAVLVYGLVLASTNVPVAFVLTLPVAMLVCACLLLCASRASTALIVKHLISIHKITYRVAVIGGSKSTTYLPAFDDERDLLIERVDLIGDNETGSPSSGVVPPNHPAVSDILSLVQADTIDSIIIWLPLSDSQAIRDSVVALRRTVVPVYLATDAFGGGLLRRSDPLYGLPLTLIQPRPLSGPALAMKAILDRVISLAILAACAPLLGLIAIAIKIESPGPALFRQPRIGFNNQPFYIFKFRSMYDHRADLFAMQQTSRRDDRITPLGRWLRRLSVDELPQLLNVLRGEMSLVGPRPHAAMTRVSGSFLDQLVKDYPLRHRTKPGITGWAQVNGSRGPLEQPEQIKRRIQLDLEYINNWSLWFDLRILALTPLSVLFSSDAF